MPAVILVMSFILSACGSSESNQTKDTQNAGQENGEKTLETGTNDSYRTEEIWCENHGNRIYGIAYIPNTSEECKPLVIFSHELGNSHTAGIPYAERLAEAGYAVYTFDFCGGTAGGNKSDGSSIGMSIMTEVSDLEAVLDTAAAWDFVDPDRIVLLGGSQGGAVTALAGSRNQEKITGMILMYPALSAAEDVHNQFETIDDVPEEYDMYGGWIRVGGNYARDIWDVDFYDELKGFEKDVLLLHGDRDTTVDISYSQRAGQVIPNCEYHMISGGGHEFFNDQFEEAVTYILACMERWMSGDVSQESKGSDMENRRNTEQSELKMMIRDIPVSVEWENNESVNALKEFVSEKPVTIQMSMYGGFEQVGPIGTNLPENDERITTKAGDIVLYSGNQIVVFYGSNSWPYTRLGKITDKTAQELAEILGSENVTITITAK